MSIFTRQNEPHSIDLMAAQRQLYSEAKRSWSFRLLGSTGIAAVAPVIVLTWDAAGVWITSVASLWLLTSRFVTRPHERVANGRGATVQEEFDTYVLDLPWNPACGERLRPQLRASATRRHFKRRAGERRAALEDWYPETGKLRHPYDALVCQQSNLAWTSQLHKEWTGMLVGFAVLLSALDIALCLHLEMSLAQYLLALAIPTVPALVDVADEWDLHRQRAELHSAADSDARARWAAAVDGSATVTIEDCRSVQDSIIRLRREPVLVPNRYYQMRKGAFETDMQSAALDLVEAGERAGLV